MFLGYNTNGLAHHAFSAACALLAETGYRGVAVTLDHDLLTWNSALENGGDWCWDTAAIRRPLEQYGLQSVVETGARFLLDRNHKHEPNLMHSNPVERQRRQGYYAAAIRLASELGSDVVSIWSGAAACENPSVLRRRLANELVQTLDYAQAWGVTLAFEPEPGMFVGDMTEFGRFLETLGEISPEHAERLGLTLDVGHLMCMGEPIAENVVRYAERLKNIHLDDGIRGIHEHRLPGEGEISFGELFDALRQIGYDRGVYVELSRHSATAPTAVQRAWDFFEKWIG